MFKSIKERFLGIVSAGSRHDKSKNTAKSRLHFVLVQDRTGLNNDDMSVFKKELVSVIERYFVIDKEGFDVSYQRDNQTTTLKINSPVIVRRKDLVGKDHIGKDHIGKDHGTESSKKSKGKKKELLEQPLPG